MKYQLKITSIYYALTSVPRRNTFFSSTRVLFFCTPDDGSSAKYIEFNKKKKIEGSLG
jgi:hypothetical protein